MISARTCLLLAAFAAGLSFTAGAFAANGPDPALSASGSALGAAGTSAASSAGSFDLINALFVFVLASFIGFGVIRRVSRLLHTPLMSLTNAISAIAVVGAIVVTGNPHYPTSMRVLGAIALFASTANIVSGFLITQRMLVMFKPRQEAGQ